jgi:hypothetical protein
VLAYLSKRFIEDPIRQSHTRLLKRNGIVFGTMFTVIAALVACTWAVSVGLDVRIGQARAALHEESRIASECVGAQAILSGASCHDVHTLKDFDSVLVSVSSQLRPVPNGSACEVAQGSPRVQTCSFGAREGTQKLNVAIAGDSHAEVWVSALAAIAESNKLRVTTYLQAGCPVTADESLRYVANAAPGIDDGCRSWRDRTIDQIASDPNIDVVVTTSKDLSYVNSATHHVDVGNGYVSAWSRWLAAGKKVIVINDVPDFGSIIVPNCIAASRTNVDPCTISRSVVATPGPLASAAAQISDARFTFVDFTHVFCDSKLCHSVIGGIPAYIDPSHLTAAFARTFAPQFARIVALNP